LLLRSAREKKGKRRRKQKVSPVTTIIVDKIDKKGPAFPQLLCLLTPCKKW